MGARVSGSVLGLSAVLLAACATGPGAEVAQRAQSELVGMPKDRLLSCAGVPARQASADGREYYTYVANPGGYGPASSVGIGAGGGSFGSGVGLGLGFSLPIGGSTSSGCEATVVLGRGGVVEQVSYPAGVSLSACAPIVENCVQPR